jgi:type IV pilus assembly protein PilA
MKNMQKGFTLIELMIVVAIIAILAAIAIPAYQDYIVRSQVSEALVLGSGPETAVAEYYQNKGDAPTSNAEAGVAAADSIGGNYVASITVGTNGLITAKMGTGVAGSGFGEKTNSKVSGNTLLLSPTFSSGSIAWTCKTGGDKPLPAKYLPSSCR